MKRTWIVLLLLIGAWATTKTPSQLSGMTSGTLESGGHTRSYTMFVPAFTLASTSAANTDAPKALVLALHGRTETGASMAKLTGLNRVAEQHGFIALYPDGLNGEWNYVRGIPGYPADTPDDTAFLAELVAKVSREHTVDPARVFVVGFSNGGFMAERLACDAPERYAAFASVAAAGFGGMDLVCPGKHPLRLLLIHGTADTNIPWNGLSRQVGGRSVPILYPVTGTLSFWADHIGCDAKIDASELPPRHPKPTTTVHRIAFRGCPPGAALMLYAVTRGGHNWPGRPGFIPEAVAGTVSLELDASTAVWNFFAAANP